MENITNGDQVAMNELSSKNQLRNGDVSDHMHTNGNSERSNLISSSVAGSHDGRSNVNTTSSSGVRHLPSNRRTTETTDVSIV